MAELFLKVLNMSLSAGWLVLALLCLRPFLRKTPRWIHVMLWGIVALRLVWPFSLESVLSLIPAKQVVSPSIMLDATPQIDSGVDFINNTINPILYDSFAPDPLVSANPLQIWIPVSGFFWLLGIGVMLVYSMVSCFLLKRKVREAVLHHDRVYVSDRIDTPFLLGFFTPKIYLPSGLSEELSQHVIAHELCHIRRKDHWWKPLAFVLLSVYWFHPLMWVAYVLLCRDIEMACDEKVIRKMGTEQRADYSQALLRCSISRGSIAACPLAFGEVSVKQRIRTVLSYRKPGFWIILISLVLCVALAVCFLTDPKGNYPAFSDKTLAVGIRDGEVGSQAEMRWNFFDIDTFENVTLPGAKPVKFSLVEVTNNGVWLVFASTVYHDGRLIQDLFLTPGESVTLITPSDAGVSMYTFSIVDEKAISENGILYLNEHSPLEGMPLNYTPEQAQADGCVVMVNGDVAYGKELWWNFYMASLAGTPGGVRILEYFDDPAAVPGNQTSVYPLSVIRDLTFDGDSYRVRWFEDVTEYDWEFKHLHRFQGSAEAASALYSSYEHYVLSDDPDITWREIRNGLTSSSFPSQPGRFVIVYTNLVYPSEPGIGTLDAVSKKLVPLMDHLQIVTLDVNEINMTLDLQVYELTDALKEYVYSMLDPQYVRIHVLEGELKFVASRFLTMPEVILYSQNEGVLTFDRLSPCKQYTPDIHVPEMLSELPAMYWIMPEEYILEVDYDRDTLEIRNVHLRDPKTGWMIDIYEEDVKAFLAGWEETTRVTQAEAQELEALVKEICSSPLEQSAPGQYILAHTKEYEKLVSYGELTLRWAFREFSEGKQISLPGHILAEACRDIMASWGESYEVELTLLMTGQSWYDAILEQGRRLKATKTVSEIRQQHPGLWLALNTQ